MGVRGGGDGVGEMVGAEELTLSGERHCSLRRLRVERDREREDKVNGKWRRIYKLGLIAY